MSQRPNFVFIITDQHRADHVGAYGNPIVKTPHIDSLATAGRRWENFYVANPVCMPNRASIMTGRMPSVHGARHNGIPLSVRQTTFVELLRDSGYDTALIGKSHLQAFTGLAASVKYEAADGLADPSPALRDAHKDNRHGPEYDLEAVAGWDQPLQERVNDHFYGFDYVEVGAGHADQVSGDYALWARSKRPDFDTLVGPENALPDNRIDAPQAWRTAVPEELYPTNWVGERAASWLRERTSDEPFFLQVSFPDPHHPFTPPGRYWDMYDPAEMPLPASFGKGDLPPLKAIREALADGSAARSSQTLFAVTEDEARAIIALTYGQITCVDDAIGKVLKQLEASGLADNTIVVFTSDHGDYMGDHGLMLKLQLHYRGVIRVPFIWSDPRSEDTDVVESGLAQSIDIAATILAAAGLAPYNGMQGRDLLTTEAPNAILVEEDNQRVMTGFMRPTRIRTVVTDTHRMSIRDGDPWSELFDLSEDPDELVNLFDSSEAAEVQSDLLEVMLRRVIELQDRSPLPKYLA